MKYRVCLEQDADGVSVGACPTLPGCVSQGVTRLEATGEAATLRRMAIKLVFAIAILLLLAFILFI